MTVEIFGKAGHQGDVDFTRRRRLGRPIALLAGIASAAGLLTPTVANAATSAASVRQPSAVVARTLLARSAASATCSKVKAASVAAIVGYSTPATNATTTHTAASAKNGEVSSVETTCVYGTGKLVDLEYTTTSKPVTVAAIESQTKAAFARTGIKAKVASYSGLGVPAVLVRALGVQELIGVSGKTNFAVMTTNQLPTAKLAALAKLAGKL